ncbi:TipJ family phage tail tip protein [Pseudodesulfovibrio tunisiensis]|uniref:TipJ family phage tail tip protein n=1 Tax=Pseudodesulfovibrio tunisiensis TaxID=463192 RepID=UPI001FB22BEB|nr:hypothetical protein [Pseudodesulfovibrio tunisiensis]
MSMHADQTVAVMGRRFDSTRPVFFETMAGTTLATVVEEAVGRLRRDRVYTPSQARFLLRYARCRVDGVEIPRTHWADTRPVPGARIEVLRTVLRRRGGGGKSPVGMVAAIAVMAVAAYAAPALLGAMGGIEAGFVGPLASGQFYISSWMTAAMTGGLMAAGSFASGALFSQAVPSLGSSTYDAGTDSPTYSISGARNAANPHGYVPLVLGSHRHTPPLGAKSWTAWEGEDQFFNMLVVWGHKDVVVSDFRIGETSLDEFADVTHAFHQSTIGGDLTLFAKSYTESSVGSALTESGGWVTRTVGEAEELSFDISFERGLTTIDSSTGRRGDRTVQFEAQYRAVGAESWIDSGLGTFSVTKAQTTFFVHTFRVESLNRTTYEARLRRVTADSDSQYIYDEATWSVARAVLGQPAFNTPIPICVSELRIKANDQLSGYVDDFNALCSSNLPSWDGAGWGTVAETANPADQMRYLLTTRSGLARPYSETKMDDTTLAEFAEWCDAQGHEFNYICDSETRVWERLTQILSAGRAAVTTDVDGLWGATIDQPGKRIRQLFTPRNSWGCKIKRGFMELPHALRVSYVDEDDDYKTKEGFVYADGYDENSAVDIVSWDYPGVTNWSAIWKMGRRHFAKLLHRQLSISLSTDWEWLAAHRGDLVGVASDVLMNVFGTARIRRLLFNIDGEEVLVGREEDIPLDEGDEPLIPIGVQIDDTVVFSDPAPARYGMAIRDNSSRLTTYEIVPEYGEENDVLRFSYVISSKPAPQLEALCSVSILGEEYDEYLVSAITPGENLTADLTLIPAAMDEIEASVSGAIPEHAPPVRLDVTRGRFIPAPRITLVRSDEGVMVRDADGTLSSRICVAYALGAGASAAESVQVQYRESSSSQWINAPTVNAGVQAFIAGVEDGAAYDIRIRAVTSAGVGSIWTVETGHTVVGKTSNPGDVNVFTLSAADNSIVATWEQVVDLDVSRYEIRSTDFGWGDGKEVATGPGSTAALPMTAAGTHTYYIRALDTTGHYSTTSASATIVVLPPAQPSVAATISGTNILLSWSRPSSSFALSGCEVLYGPDLASAESVDAGLISTSRQFPGAAGCHRFWVRYTDAAGNTGPAASVDMTIIAPGAVLVTQQVIDNNVLLYWTEPETGTFPVSNYIVRSGETLETSMMLGTVDARFISHFESQGGSYTYWVAAVDTSGNEGAFASVSATVSQPPDYVLLYDYDSPLGGTATRFIMEGGELIGPAFDETWQEHFSRCGQTTMQDFADAGFPLYLLPNATSAVYEEEIDYGTVLSGSKITVTPTMQALTGAPSATCRIEVRAATDEAWRLVADDWQGYATAFRYLRVTVSVISDGRGAVRISGLNIRYDIKQRKEGGMMQCLASHSEGTPVTFADSYVDIQAIAVTPKAGSAARYALYDFVDEPNPTGFSIYLYNASGARVDGEASWSIIGV